MGYGNIALKYKKLLFLLLIILAMPLYAGSAAADNYGIDEDVDAKMQMKGRARVGYDVAVSEAVVAQPSSIVAQTCFGQAVESEASISGQIFSGDITKSVKEVVEKDIESHFEDYSWDDILTYDKEIKVNGSFSISANLSIGAGEGPTVKNVECENMGKIWDAERNNKPFQFPIFEEVANKLLEGTKPSRSSATTKAEKDLKKFEDTWYDSSDKAKQDLEDAKDVDETLKAKKVNPEYDGREEPCEVLEKIGVTLSTCDY